MFAPDVPSKCHRAFWLGENSYECKLPHGHGGSHTADGNKPLDERTQLIFTVSWRKESKPHSICGECGKAKD